MNNTEVFKKLNIKTRFNWFLRWNVPVLLKDVKIPKISFSRRKLRMRVRKITKHFPKPYEPTIPTDKVFIRNLGESIKVRG